MPVKGKIYLQKSTDFNKIFQEVDIDFGINFVDQYSSESFMDEMSTEVKSHKQTILDEYVCKSMNKSSVFKMLYDSIGDVERAGVSVLDDAISV